MTSQLGIGRLLDVPDAGRSGGAGAAGLDVRPFRGLRYDPAVVPDVAAATCPPYDVVEPAAVRGLEELEPHNVVRLILPREDGCGPEGRYAHAAQTLRAWVRDGVLVQDEPGFYVYEESSPGQLHRGVVAAVGLSGADTGAVLPHEEVMPLPVADRQALMRATGANLEPILLVHEGDQGAGEAVDSVVAAAVLTPPALDVRTPEGRRHRLWHLPGQDAPAQVLREAFSRRRALIADGHHRWAAYQRLCRELDEPFPDAGWDAGLALLVDADRYPLAVGAIHRLVAGLTLADALAALAGLEGSLRVTRLSPDALPDPDALQAVGREHPALDLVAADGAARLELLDPDALATPGQPPEWAGLDAAVLHGALLPRWGAGDEDARAVTYCHDAHDAVAAARGGAGLAVLLNPVPVAQVLAIAAAGATMPRKSTSFGPKPRTGLVLRQLAGPDGA